MNKFELVFWCLLAALFTWRVVYITLFKRRTSKQKNAELDEMFSAESLEKRMPDIRPLGFEIDKQPHKSVRIPLGVWTLDNFWQPNFNLRMTPKEQHDHNVRNGYTMKLDYDTRKLVFYAT